MKRTRGWKQLVGGLAVGGLVVASFGLASSAAAAPVPDPVPIPASGTATAVGFIADFTGTTSGGGPITLNTRLGDVTGPPAQTVTLTGAQNLI